jgi:hypothetical protein
MDIAAPHSAESDGQAELSAHLTITLRTLS